MAQRNLVFWLLLALLVAALLALILISVRACQTIASPAQVPAAITATPRATPFQTRPFGLTATPIPSATPIAVSTLTPTISKEQPTLTLPLSRTPTIPKTAEAATLATDSISPTISPMPTPRATPSATETPIEGGGENAGYPP